MSLSRDRLIEKLGWDGFRLLALMFELISRSVGHRVPSLCCPVVKLIVPILVVVHAARKTFAYCYTDLKLTWLLQTRFNEHTSLSRCMSVLRFVWWVSLVEPRPASAASSHQRH